jgi:hypothetical protein
MKHFTIDTDNNITVHASKKAARETGAPVFATEEQLADLIGADNKRLVEIWNSLAGAKPVTKFANRKVATERIWKAIQSLGEAPAAPAPVTQAEQPVATEPAPEVVPEVTIDATTDQTAAAAERDTLLPAEVSEPASQPEGAQEPGAPAEPVASVDAPAPNVAPAEPEPNKKAGRAKKAPKAPKVAKPAKTESGPREGSKTAQVVSMLQREGGATLAEIMTKMGWQKHTVRGFMAGTMKKAGFAVESFKPEGGERSYRINK